MSFQAFFIAQFFIAGLDGAIRHGVVKFGTTLDPTFKRIESVGKKLDRCKKPADIYSYSA